MRREGWPLSRYLVALAALFVITALVSAGVVRAQTAAEARSSAVMDAQFAADLAASDISMSLAALETSIARTAANPAVATVFASTGPCSLSFGVVGLFQRGHLDLLRPDGSVACSSLTDRPGASYVDSPWIAAAATGPTFAEVFVDPRTGTLSVVSAAPVPGGRGVAAGFVDISEIGPSLGARYAGPHQYEFVITSADGAAVIARSIDALRWTGSSLRGTAFATSADPVERPDLDGVTRLYGHSLAGTRGWQVYAGIRRDAALAAATDLFTTDVAIIGIGLLALLAATVIVHRQIAGPIEALGRSVRMGTGGDRPIAISGPVEIVRLAKDFNDLVGRLRTELAARERGREAQARLAALVSSTTDAIVRTRLDGVVTDWNAGAERLFGYRAEEIVGTIPAMLIPHDGGITAHDVAADVLGPSGPLGRVALGERVEGYETTRIRRDGSTVALSLSVAPIFDESGKVTAIATVARDITGQRDAERKRLELEERLRQFERLEGIGRLVGGIAHDFNNLNAIILNYCDFIAERLAPDDPNREDLSQIRVAAERATVFTRQLMTFARRGPVSAEDLDLAQVVRDLEPLLRRSVRESIVIEVRVQPQLAGVHADRGQLEQVLLNLVINARDAMAAGGTLRIEVTNVEHDVDSAAQYPDLAPGPYVQLSVIDTGEGMTKEVLDRAFEPFFTTKPAGTGTGLGLATVYGVVRQAGGRVSIYSEVGRGTTVRVLLPAIGKVAATPVAPPPPPPILEGAAQRTILLVEDEPAVRAAAERILASAGFGVLSIDSADRALALMSGWTEPLDLLLTDMVMPGMSGRELALRLRAIRPGLPVVFMTGYSEDLVRRDPETLDGAILQKPFTREPLLAAVGAALDERR